MKGGISYFLKTKQAFRVPIYQMNILRDVPHPFIHQSLHLSIYPPVQLPIQSTHQSVHPFTCGLHPPPIRRPYIQKGQAPVGLPGAARKGLWSCGIYGARDLPAWPGEAAPPQPSGRGPVQACGSIYTSMEAPWVLLD